MLRESSPSIPYRCMIKITNGIDQESMEFVFKIKCNFFKKYFSNFVGYLSKKKENLPENYSVSKLSDDTVRIGFPIPKDAIGPEQFGMSAVKVPNVGPVISTVIDTFSGHALAYELGHTEFVPLNGYPVENLQKEILEAVKGKRNLCVLETYEEYLNAQNEHKFKFKQHMVEYGTDEWADIVLHLINGDIESVRKMCSQKLKIEDWF